MRIAERYEVVRRLGQGGAGSVFLVRDGASRGAERALKRLTRLSDEATRAAFVREFSVLASLSLPGVARVYDLGWAQDQDGSRTLFFTREMIDGAPLDAALQGRSVDAKLRVLLEAARSIVTLHRAGVVHGDLKPGNVLVDAHDRPWLIDFGLATSGASAHAPSGAGTIAFMAPEILRGERATAASDLFAFGATMWQVLTGRTPHEDRGKNALTARAQGEVPRVPSDIPVEVKRALEATSRAVHPAPSERFAAMSELCAVIESLLGDAPAASLLPFVPPRPRGQDALVASLESWAVANADVGETEGRAARVSGAALSGRTTLLRALKWRLQIRDAEVLWLAGGTDDDAELALISRLSGLSGWSAEQRTTFEQALLSGATSLVSDDLIIEGTRMLRALGPVTVIVDDLDDASERLLARVRCLLSAEGKHALRLLVSTHNDRSADALCLELGALESFRVPELSPREMASIVEEILGVVDARTLDTLYGESQGVAGVIIEALRHLREQQGATREDVRDAVARAKKVSSPPSAQLAKLIAVVEGGDAGKIMQAFGAIAPMKSDLRPFSSMRDAFARARARVRPEQALVLSVLEGELEQAHGDCAHSVDVLQALSLDASTPRDLLARATMTHARALNTLGQTDAASALIDARLALLGSDARAAVLFKELAKICLARGEYDRVIDAASRGLRCVEDDAAVHAELLCSLAMAASYRGRSDEAEAQLHRALEVATKSGAPSVQALVLTYYAIHCQRADRRLEAKKHYESALRFAEQAEDVGMMATLALNFGTIAFDLVDLRTAGTHYEHAMRLARRAGRAATLLHARVNLAQLDIYRGLYARAGTMLDRVFVEAEALDKRAVVAHATALVGERHARLGDADRALASLDDAVSRYKELGQTREVVEALLEGAEMLIDRGGASDVSAATARLAAARTALTSDGDEEVGLRLSLALARARSISGGGPDDVLEMAEVADKAHLRAFVDLEWKAWAARATAEDLLGASASARESRAKALAILERMALSLAVDQQQAFWSDPRRKKVRSLAAKIDITSLDSDARARRAHLRLLETTMRMLREHDAERLLERITDAAIELAGAERGFVLLVNERGELDPVALRWADGVDATTVSFSRTIADVARIDGAPVITVDARTDARFADFHSVHHLALRSVAAFPIRGRERVLGVLYLEHRARSGRFDDADVESLTALSAQAAIALENARLFEQLRAKQQELEAANQSLAHAKEELERVLDARTEEVMRMRSEVDAARASFVEQYARYGIIGQSSVMRGVFERIDRVAPVAMPVVICGESGTGKELVAKAIHARSLRADGPFIAINCGALTETLLEAELFGYERGAFTGADRARKGLFSQANGGTLFLDEISDMPAKMQVELLRVLAEKRVRRIGSDVEENVDVRIVAATQKPLDALVQAGRFREDLFYRLSVVQVDVPPLRARRDDIPLLADHFLARLAAREQGGRKRLTRAALDALMTADWPGNVRQLEHALSNAYILSARTTLEANDFVVQRSLSLPPPAPTVESAAIPASPSVSPPASIEAHKNDERSRILDALARTQWNRARAAEMLGMPRRTFYRRLHEHGIIEGE